MNYLDINDAYFVLNEIRGILETKTINIRDKEIINRIIKIQNNDLIKNAASLLYYTVCNEPLTVANKCYAYALTEYYLNKNKACTAKANFHHFMFNIKPKTSGLNDVEDWLYKNIIKVDEIKETIYKKYLIKTLYSDI